MAIFALLGYWINDHVLLFSTAFGGAYLLIRGIGAISGNYPNEFTIA
jgi:hypothetical protein